MICNSKSNMCFGQEKFVAHAPEDVQNLLLKLKLVKVKEEVEVLYRGLNESYLAPLGYGIGLFYATKLIDVLTQKDVFIEQQEINILFEILLDLFSCCRDEDLEVFAVEVHECFKLLSNYHKKTINASLHLPVETHRKAFEICSDILVYRHISDPAVESVVFAMAHVINHRDFTAGEQMAFVNTIQSLSLTHKISIDLRVRAFNMCSKFENASPCFHSLICEKLLQFAMKKMEFAETRLAIIEELPFDPNFFNISYELPEEAVKTLATLATDKEEDSIIRDCAAKRLCKWVWTCQKFQFKLNNLQQYALDELTKLIKSYKITPDEVVQVIIVNLFDGILEAEQWHPTGKYLFHLFKELVCDKEFPWGLKLQLAYHMPKGCCDFGKDEPNAIDLFFFMLDKLYDPNFEMMLKRIYVQRLMSCYLSKKTRQTIADRKVSIPTIEAFMDLEILKTEPELYLTALLTFNKLFDSQKTQNRDRLVQYIT